VRTRSIWIDATVSRQIFFNIVGNIRLNSFMPRIVGVLKYSHHFLSNLIFSVLVAVRRRFWLISWLSPILNTVSILFVAIPFHARKVLCYFNCLLLRILRVGAQLIS
jgi:hypothetical protein